MTGRLYVGSGRSGYWYATSIVCMLALTGAVHSSAEAATRFWKSASTSPPARDFNDPTNWTTGLVPGSADTAAFSLGGTVEVLINADTTNDFLDMDSGLFTFSGTADYTATTSFRLTSTVFTLDGMDMILKPINPVGSITAVNNATAIVENAATLTSDGRTFSIHDNGQLLLRGTGSKWDADTIELYLDGNLSTSDGAELNTAFLKFTDGDVTISGNTTTADFAMAHIGSENAGTAQMFAMINADVTADTTYVGYGSTSNGRLEVRNPGTTWTNNQDIYVGYDGLGHLLVLDQATLSCDDLWVGQNGNGQIEFGGAADVTIADRFQAGSNASATASILSGAQVETDYLTIWGPGSGSEVNVQNSGTVLRVNQDLSIGGDEFTAQGTGELATTDGGKVIIGGKLTVWGTGTLLGQSGGTVYTNTIDVRPGATLALASTSSVFINQLITSGSMNFDNSLGIGHDQSAGTSGALTVSGGDALGVGHDLFVGYSAHASVDVIGGGQLNVQRSAYLADGSGADGTVNVSGNGSSFYVAQNLFVGEIGATALLDIDNAANVTVMNTLEIAAGSTVNLAGGSLNAVAISLASRGHLNLNGGTLRFIEFSGSPLNVGSTVEVQENSAITGTYRQTSGGTTEFDVSDPGVQPVDFLAVDTAVQLAGEIAFVHDPSTEPDLGQRMGLIGTSARGRTGTFDQVSNMFLSNDLALAVGYESDAVWVEVAIPGDITLDQFIDEADLAYLADGWKLGSGYTWESGDVTGDGVIDEADLAYLADGWKIPPVAVSVPEPTTATLVLLGILLRRRR